MLWDRLQLSEPETSESERLAMNRLAATIVWTLVVNGEKTGVEKLGNVEDSKVTLPAKSSYVLVDTESYNKSNN